MLADLVPLNLWTWVHRSAIYYPLQNTMNSEGRNMSSVSLVIRMRERHLWFYQGTSEPLIHKGSRKQLAQVVRIRMPHRFRFRCTKSVQNQIDDLEK